MTEQFPVFDDEWIAAARHREASVSELERRKRSVRKAARRSRRRRRARKLLFGVTSVGALAGFIWYVAVTPAPDVAGDAWFVDHRSHVPPALFTDTDVRPRPQSGTGTRLRPTVTPDRASSSHQFIRTRDDNTPVTYDPCRPVQFVVNPSGAPADHKALIGEVLATASTATGLQLDLVDDTTESPTAERAAYQPDLYGDRWAPVLIAWTDETVIADLAGDIAGLGGSSWTTDHAGTEWFVTGLLYLDTELGDDAVINRAVLLHELGHVLGLDHVDDPEQIMHAAAFATDFGAGDLSGLARLGAGGCAGRL